ncbi:MAG: family 10 glycosylhydrolase, partial [Oscillospiraceae bacterium]|nr:family 10 glycosylhydrolase [Oscillospiraceae bacterium]
MKNKNRNLKAVMAVIIIFLVASLIAGTVMALKDTSATVENSSSIQTESENSSDEVSSYEDSAVSQQEASSSDNSTSVQSESTEQSDDTSSADSETSQYSSETKPTATPTATPTPAATQTPQTIPVTSQMKAMWISYLEFQSVDFSSKTAFVNDMTQMFRNCKSMGLDTVIVQVRPFGDALYKSSVFPSSHLITGVQGAQMAYDPLEEMVKIAHGINLRIEAWVNPYRVRLSSKMPDNIAQNNPANNKDLVIEANGGVYYNPALSEVQDLVVKGVAEIVENYDVDGIHLDDYFYPSTEASLDEVQYKASGTSLSQADWRRENVNTLVRKLYSTVKGIDSSVT